MVRLPFLRLSLLLLLFRCLPANAQVTGLTFRPVDAAYSTALDRIILVSATPNQLHIYNPATVTDQVVALAETPLNLSVSPDGKHAAVAFSDAVAYADLQAGTVSKTFSNVAVGTGRVFVGSGYIYVFQNNTGGIISINVGSAAATTSAGFSYISAGVFDSSVNAVYGTSSSYSLNKYDASAGEMNGSSTTGPYNYNIFSVCGPLTLSPDGATIYSGCGTVFRASTTATKDMRYLGVLPGISSAQNLTVSPLNQIAVIPKVSSYSYPATPLADTVVDLFDSSSFTQTGQLSTTPFVVNSVSFPAHGRWVFYNSASSSAFIVTQADSTAGLEQDYAIEKVSLTNANSCGATFASASAAATAPGSYATAQILSGEHCLFTAVSNASWITLTSGYSGSGNTTLTYLVRPNLSATSRTGTITLGSQSFSVTQDGAAAASALNPLSFKPVAADYDKALDKIVMVSSSPNELHIYDPVTLADQIVPLGYIPLSVSVRPDGLFAAVGHSGEISIVDLQAAKVNQTIPVDMDNGGILLASNGYAYAFPSQTSSWGNINSVLLSTGALSVLQDTYYGSIPRLDLSGNFIYVGGSYGGSKLNISSGPAALVNSQYGTLLGNFWLSESGDRLVNSAGNFFFTSAVASQDLQPDGKLSGASSVAWAANSAVQHQTAILSDPSGVTPAASTLLQIYADNGLAMQSQSTLPSFSNAGTSYVSHGKFLFWNAAESKLFAITEADTTSGLLSDYAVYTVSGPESLPTCTYAVSPSSLIVSASYSYYTSFFNVTSNCGWTPAVSNSSWLSANNNGPAYGNGQFSLYVQSNTGAARSASITVGNQTVTVNQSAAACIYAISSTNQAFTQTGGTGSVSLTTSAGCPWSVQSSAAWLTITGSASGTGSAVIQYSAAANATSATYLSGYLNIVGNQFNVTETSTPAKLVFSANTVVISGPVGETSGNSVTVTNVGGSAATIYSPYTVGPFQINGPVAWPLTLSPGASVSLTVSYTPTSTQTVSGSATIYNSGFNSYLNLLGTSTAPSDGAYDDRSSSIAYTGAWGQNLDVGRFDGTQTYSNHAGDTASFTFTGTQVAYVYEAQANMGHVQVTIDESVVTADLDEYAPALKAQQRAIYSGLSEGVHTITVSVLGTHDGPSSGSYGIIDAFLVGSRADEYDDRDPAITYNGAWGQNMDEGRYAGTQSYSNHAQDSASFTFTGTQVAYVYETQSNMGHAQISIDGTVVTADLDEYSATVGIQKRMLYSGLSAGTHTITVSVLGTSDTASSNSYVIVDAFLLGAPGAGEYDDSAPDIGYAGSWQSNIDVGRYLGTQTFSGTAGDTATFTFNGTQVSYVYETQSNLGHAQVSIDGAVVTPDLDEYSPALKAQQQIAYTGLTNGPHTIQVSALGTKDASSNGPYVIVDAFVVAPLGPGIYDDSEAAVSYKGSWASNTEYTRWANTQTFSNTAGDTASFTFSGTQVAYVYATQPNMGHVQVSIDGAVVTTDLDEYSNTEISQLRKLYTGLSSGTHTITVTILGTQDANSTAAYGVVDAFIVGPGAATYDDRDRALSYAGTWGSNVDMGRYQGTQTFSNSTGSQCSFSFTGTQVIYVYDAQPNMGHAVVRIDGNVVDASLDEYSPTLQAQQQRVYSGLAPGPHTITVAVQGLADGTATGSYVIVDAFIVSP